MKARIPDAHANVTRRAGDHNPVLLTIGGLELALTDREAFVLADRLVDAAEAGDGK